MGAHAAVGVLAGKVDAGLDHLQFFRARVGVAGVEETIEAVAGLAAGLHGGELQVAKALATVRAAAVVGDGEAVEAITGCRSGRPRRCGA